MKPAEHMKNVSAETHMSLCECKIWFGHAQEYKHYLKCEMFAIIGLGERNWIPSDLFKKWGSLSTQTFASRVPALQE